MVQQRASSEGLVWCLRRRWPCRCAGYFDRLHHTAPKDLKAGFVATMSLNDRVYWGLVFQAA